MAQPPPESVDKQELRKHPVLEGLEDDLLDTVAQETRPLRLERDEILFRQGEPARHFYLVREGQIKLFRLGLDGHEKIIDVTGPGGSFAEAVMFMAERSYPVNTAAIEPSELLAVPTEPVRRTLESSTEACFRLLAHMSKRLRQHVAEIDALSLQNGALRLANYLLETRGVDQDEEVVQLPLSKKTLAARLSLQPETLSRLLRQFEEQGLIAVQGSEIRILDPEALPLVALEGRR